MGPSDVSLFSALSLGASSIRIGRTCCFCAGVSFNAADIFSNFCRASAFSPLAGALIAPCANSLGADTAITIAREKTRAASREIFFCKIISPLIRVLERGTTCTQIEIRRPDVFRGGRDIRQVQAGVKEKLRGGRGYLLSLSAS